MKPNFRDIFSQNTQISNFMEIHPVWTELFHTDGWTDRYDEANSRFSQLHDAPQKQQLLPYTTLTGFYNRGETCLLRGTNWVFK
jgi:hypothetical protein